ncbi:MAG: DUF6600 domain-containing protein [Rhodothermaceae bacterium]
MKRLAIILVTFLILAGTTEARYKGAEVSYEIFYESLAPYGEWIEIDYDLVVWKPYSPGRHWAPYKKGEWFWTSDGWYWDSYEPFGWATYHYGRWHHDDYYGWLWFPGERWAPAWVEWRYSDNYIGWTPLSPYAKFKAGFGIRFTTKKRHHSHWNFVSINRFHGCDVSVHIVHHSRTPVLLSRTKYRTNYYHRNGRIVNGGVNITFVEKRSGRRIKTRKVVTTQTHFNRNNRVYRDKRRIDVYQPDLTKTRTRSSRKSVTIKRSKRSVEIERSKVVTGRKTVKRSSTSRSGYTSRNVERQDHRTFDTPHSRRDKVRRSSERRETSTNVYNRSISESKRHSRKSSGRSSSRIREDRREHYKGTSRRGRSESHRTSRRR